MALTTASPLQRAICRVIDGRSLGECDALDAFGGVRPPEVRPSIVTILSAIRSAKSMIAAAVAIRATQTCDLSGLKRGEVPRVSVVSILKDLAQATYSHMTGTVLGSPDLAPLLVGQPTADSFALLNRDYDRPVEIKVVAGAKAGNTLVSRWSAGVVFDEAPRMQGQEDGVVNLDHALTAVQGRLLPGAQIMLIGSPWAPFGPVYEIYRRYWGKPSRTHVVIKAPGPAMNPVWWTPERCERLRDTDPVAYRTDVQAEFVDAEESMFADALVTASTRDAPMHIPYRPGHDYVAAMDPATRGNAWTLVVATRLRERKIVVYNRQWLATPGEPLRPRDVLRDVAEILSSYQIDTAYTDQWAADALTDIADEFGLSLSEHPWTAAEKTRLFTNLATQMLEGMVELPPDPALANDLKLVRRVATQTGVAIHLPKSKDGRHSDYAPALAMALSKWVEDYTTPAPPKGTPDYARYVAAQMEEAEIAAELAQQQSPWWAREA